MQYGREPGGEKAEELGVCPAAVDERLHSVHGGRNSGRTCWVMAGTFCDGAVQGTFAQKYRDCTKCKFYRQVMREEGVGYQSSLVLLKKLKILR